MIAISDAIVRSSCYTPDLSISGSAGQILYPVILGASDAGAAAGGRSETNPERIPGTRLQVDGIIF